MEDGQAKSLILDRKVNIASLDEDDSQPVESPRQDIASDQMHAYYATISPARRLPPELVAEILFQSQPPHIDMHSNSTLCSICSAWRAIAISTPRLWTTIRMTISNHNQMALLCLWCERAGSLPLEIGLMIKPSLGENPVLVLTPYLPNVQRMYLRLSGHCLKQLQTLSKGTFRLLEFLFISISHGLNEAAPDTADIDVFESAPRLTTVCISGHTLGCRLLLPPQISHIDDYMLHSANDYFHVLQHCPNVEHLVLHLDFSDVDNDEIMRHQPFLLPHLRTLDLTLCGNSPEAALRSFVVPSLRFISIKACTTWPHSSFLSLISRSSCAPERLRILQPSLDNQLFLECLRSLPSLIELELHMDAAGTWLTDALVYDAGDPKPLVPRLEVLRLYVGLHLPAESLVRMVESRWWPNTRLSDQHRVARLKTVCFDIFGDPAQYEHVLQRLRRCRDEGLAIGRR